MIGPRYFSTLWENVCFFGSWGSALVAGTVPGRITFFPGSAAAPAGGGELHSFFPGGSRYRFRRGQTHAFGRRKVHALGRRKVHALGRRKVHAAFFRFIAHGLPARVEGPRVQSTPMLSSPGLALRGLSCRLQPRLADHVVISIEVVPGNAAARSVMEVIEIVHEEDPGGPLDPLPAGHL